MSEWSKPISGLLLLLSAMPLWAQGKYQRELERHRQELEALQRSIGELRRQLNETQHRTESLRLQLQRLQRYRTLLERSIALTTHELQRLDDSLQRLHAELAHINARRDTLGEYQRQLLRGFYTRWMTTPAERSPLQHYVRTLLQHYRHHDQTLARRSDTLAQLQQQLKNLQERRHLWLQRREEQRRELEQTIRRQEHALTELRQHQQTLHLQLRQRQQSAHRLQRTIERLVAAAQRAQRSLQPPSRSRPLPSPPALAVFPPPALTTPSQSFRWPSSSRRLLRGYGLQRNPETGVAWDNPGIDIAAPAGSPVRAIAPGAVKLLQWLPTYQNVVVVEHSGGFYSVYGNLQRPAVSPGTPVTEGSTLGTAGTTPDGEGFHFQLWRGRQRLNPLEWLR